MKKREDNRFGRGEWLRGIQLSEPDLNCRYFQTGEHPGDSGLNGTLTLVRRAVAPCPQAAQHFVPSGAGGNLHVFTGYDTAGVLVVLVIIGQRPEIGCSDEPVRKSAKQVPSYLKHRYPDLPLYGMMTFTWSLIAALIPETGERFFLHEPE